LTHFILSKIEDVDFATVSKWDLTNPEEAASCYHYTNSTPLFTTTRIVDGVEHIGNLNKNKF
jgi:hypothetical protein